MLDYYSLASYVGWEGERACRLSVAGGHYSFRLDLAFRCAFAGGYAKKGFDVFRWLFGRKERPQAQELNAPCATLPKPPSTVYMATSNGDFHDILGASNHQDALARICRGRADASAEVDVNVVLRLEPEGPLNGNAVAVLIEKQKVGHLSTRDAVLMDGFLRRQEASEAHCLGEIIRGWRKQNGDEGHFIVKLDIAWPPVRD